MWKQNLAKNIWEIQNISKMIVSKNRQFFSWSSRRQVKDSERDVFFIVSHKFLATMFLCNAQPLLTSNILMGPLYSESHCQWKHQSQFIKRKTFVIASIEQNNTFNPAAKSEPSAENCDTYTLLLSCQHAIDHWQANIEQGHQSNLLKRISPSRN